MRADQWFSSKILLEFQHGRKKKELNSPIKLHGCDIQKQYLKLHQKVRQTKFVDVLMPISILPIYNPLCLSVFENKKASYGYLTQKIKINLLLSLNDPFLMIS